MISSSKQGALLHTKVTPKAAFNQICGIENDKLKLKVASPPEKSEANHSALELLSQALGIPKSCIFLFKGQRSRCKTFLFTKESVESLSNKITRYLENMKTL
ncbi:MAG: DUF167 domain-containing protein [Chlamydiae bacterium]|nr:DUF167 domain-containing protein [Chlamydiota bacterium]